MSSPRKLAANSCTSASSRGLLTGIAQWPCSTHHNLSSFPHFATATSLCYGYHHMCIPPWALDSGAHYSTRVKDRGRYKKGHLLYCSEEHKMNESSIPKGQIS